MEVMVADTTESAKANEKSTVVMGETEKAGKLGVGVHPAMPKDVEEDLRYWLPMYFSNWVQTSLVGADEVTMKLLGRFDPPPTARPPSFPQTGVVDPELRLRYGKKYQFRVRLMDHTGGGPQLHSATGTLGPSPTAGITFRRWIKPLAPRYVGKIPVLDPIPGAETALDFIEVKRPLMFCPGVMFAGYTYNGQDTITELMAMAEDIAAHPRPDPVIEPGLLDPDVDPVEITVLLHTLT
jgi:hypothetical protein